jgi:hypothetical protein
MLTAYGQSALPPGSYPSALPPEQRFAPQQVPVGNTLALSLKNLGDPDGYTLRTVKTERRYEFTRPTQWNVMPSSAIKVTFQHSASLLPERSSLNVLVNNRMLKTIRLGKDNTQPTTVTIPVPPGLLKDKNVLSFQVDQHYTYQCEDPFSEELWTTILPDTTLTLNYTPKPALTNLAEFPKPFFDPLGYGATKIGYVVSPSGMSDDSLTALAQVSAGLGRAISWHPAQPTVLDPGAAYGTNENLVVVGTPSENPAVSQLASQLPAQPGVDEGLIAVVRHPSYPDKAVLIVTGGSPVGVRKAASYLVQQPMNQMMAGPYTLVKDFSQKQAHPYRGWQGFMQGNEASFAMLGLDTLTTRGITGLPLYYSLRVMPDLDLKDKTKAVIHTIYSYSSQLDATQSKLEVRLNGKALKSIPLSNKEGANLAVADIEVPAEELFTYNDLEYQFHLYPEKYNLCNFVTDRHIWGTIHSASTVKFDSLSRIAVPDVGLLNDGGYPFTAYPDMTQTAIVVGASPTLDELGSLVQFATRMGRLSQSRLGYAVAAHHAASLPDAVKNDSNLVFIGSDLAAPNFDKLPSKTKLLVEGNTAAFTNGNEKLATLGYRADQGIVEELLSPFNDKRVALILYGQNSTAQQQIARLFQSDDLFNRIDQGNVLVIGPNEPSKSVVAVQKGEAKFIGQDEAQSGGMPLWGWIAIGFFALIGLIAVLKGLMGGNRR